VTVMADRHLAAGGAPASDAPLRTPRPTRLLGMSRPGGPLDLGQHEELYGPLPRPVTPGDRRWSDWFLSVIAASDLRGRGGGGFPTAHKLDRLRSARRGAAVVVNAMESEPASDKDRVLCTGAPHLVLDGAELVAAALAAHEIIVCAPRSHPEVARSLAGAAAGRRFVQDGRVDVRLEQLPDHYVASEESSLVHWLRGGNAVPLFRPRRGEPLRLGRRPVVVHNAETLAQMALIVRQTATASAHGSEQGSIEPSLLVTVSGAVARPGVFEVPQGRPLSRVLAEAGAASLTPGVLVGGYGGSWLDGSHVGVPLRPEPLARLGCALGTGALVVLPTGACGLAESARVVRWMAGQSAGQCGPCVFGLAALADDLERLAFSRPTGSELERLRRRLGTIAGRGACRHPDGVVRMASSALDVFADDVSRHLASGPCPGVARPSVMPRPDVGPAPRTSETRAVSTAKQW
jgi:NADH:ubiquinone oxidoreductase subunit F (NADH-binding)